MSKKGVKQSIALGKKLLKNSISFDRTIIGPLKRHQQTFDGINEGYGGSLVKPSVIDEFADLIMTARKEIETPIARLAQ